MNTFIPFWEQNDINTKVDTDLNTTANSDGNIGVDFSFFSDDAAKKIDSGVSDVDDKPKKRTKPRVAINGEELPDRDINPIPGSTVADVDYASTYNETNNLIRGAIMQADELGAEIRKDIEDVRNSKTLKGRYTYLVNLNASASSILTTKISAIKELNSTITQVHNLELNRMKALKLDKADQNDDMKMMDIYSAFVNTPIGTYTPAAPSIQDITIGINGQNNNISAVEMTGKQTNGGTLTPEQNRMRMESNTNIQTVVRYDQSTGMRVFDVIDRNTGASVPNYPRPDSFLLEDTTIDVANGIARNRNINTVWPLVVEGSNRMNINEY